MSLLHISVLSSSTYQPGSARAQSMMGYLAVGDVSHLENRAHLLLLHS